jgi:hemolysin III
VTETALRPFAHVEAPPSWRGVSHEKGFAIAPALGLLLVAAADGAAATAAAAIFAVTMTAMLGASAANHRAAVAPRWEPWLRRADHTAINLFIAGTCTAVALVTLSGAARIAVPAAVCAVAVGASAVSLLWVRVPGWIPASSALATGWVGGAALIVLAPAPSPAAVALLALGGVMYTVGGVVYVLHRPEPHESFGHHELFHALVLGGVACHYTLLLLAP